jgi:hypothetical protein
VSRWTQEDYLRNETESENYEKTIEAFLTTTEYTTWFEEKQAELYEPTLAKGIQQTLMTSHEDRREAARFALRQLTALAEEAREEAHDLQEILDAHLAGLIEKAEPPGHTCPAIDKVQHVLRQIVWRMDNPDKPTRQDARDLMVEGLALLETVRTENRQMRAAHAEMQRKVKS